MARFGTSKTLVRMLLVGESGVGKTTSLASLAAGGYQVGILDLEAGIEALHVMAARCSTTTENMRFVSVGRGGKHTERGMFEPFNAQGFNALTKTLVGFDSAEGEDAWGNPFGWSPERVLVIDSLSGLCDCLMDASIGQANAERAGSKGDLERAHQGIYLQAGQTLGQFLSALTQSLKCHLVVVAHPRVLTDKEGRPTGKIVIRGIGQKSAESVPALFNHAVELETVRRMIDRQGKKTQVWVRRWNLEPTEDLDFLKSPATLLGAPGKYEGDDGLRKIFDLVTGKTTKF